MCQEDTLLHMRIPVLSTHRVISRHPADGMRTLGPGVYRGADRLFYTDWMIDSRMVITCEEEVRLLQRKHTYTTKPCCPLQ